jgi:hypothetical protein
MKHKIEETGIEKKLLQEENFHHCTVLLARSRPSSTAMCGQVKVAPCIEER